jgi:hypothetical protein
VRWIKRALLLIILGLVVQLFCLYAITPGTFMIFAGVGVTLVGAGLIIFVWAGVRARKRARSGGHDDG